MRIGLIIYGSLDTLTGGYLYDRIVVQGLVRLGHEVEVISLTGGSVTVCRPSLAADCWLAASTSCFRTNSAIRPFFG